MPRVDTAELHIAADELDRLQYSSPEVARAMNLLRSSAAEIDRLRPIVDAAWDFVKNKDESVRSGCHDGANLAAAALRRMQIALANSVRPR